MKALFLSLLLSTSTALAQVATQSVAQPASPPKTLFYMTDHPDSVRDFMQNQAKIDIIVPTWYGVNSAGLVYGEADPLVMQVVKQRHMTLFPIVAMFDKAGAHNLVGSEKAQDLMIASLIAACKRNGYDGFQLDLENIGYPDRDAFSAMVKRIADGMHAQHLQLQIAVVPNAPGYPGHTDFSRWIFNDWRGVFDLQALAKSVDLLCLMTYDEHTRWTPPGPVGGWLWTKENLDYALQYVPREKLSLGVALYGYHWYAGDPGVNNADQKPNITADYIGGEDVKTLRQTYKANEQWDPQDHVAFFWFYKDQTREWIFYTEKHGFTDRYNLAKEEHLQGICMWVLGQEDEDIWSALPERK